MKKRTTKSRAAPSGNDFEALSGKFLALAEKQDVPRSLARSVVSMSAGPAHGVIAYTTWYRWFNATPGDPAGSLTIGDIQRLFSNSARSWDKAAKATERLAGNLAKPANQDALAALVKRRDWKNVRGLALQPATADQLNPSAAVVDTPLGAAEKGMFQQVYLESMRTAGVAAQSNAEMLEELASGGAAALARLEMGQFGVMRRRRSSGYYAAEAAGWGLVATAGAVGLGMASMPIAAGTAAGAAVVCAGYAIYTAMI